MKNQAGTVLPFSLRFNRRTAFPARHLPPVVPARTAFLAACIVLLALSANTIQAQDADSLGSGADSLLLPSDPSPVDTVRIPSAMTSERLPLPPLLPPDTTSPGSLSPLSFRLTNREFDRHGYKDSGEASVSAPGLFPRQTELYGQPFYLVPPGGSARDVTVWYRGRPYNDPLTSATNFSTLTPEEVQIAEYEPAAEREISSSGPVIRWIPPYVFSRTPETRLVYRQGWNGLGRVDWRIQQQVTDGFAYYAGVNITEFQGRYENTAANSDHIRLGARQTIRGIGHLSAHWREVRDEWGRAFDSGSSSLLREDIDLILASGDPGDSLNREAGVWYVRSKSGYHYGDEDGSRYGIRLQQSVIHSGEHHLFGRVDFERTAARFTRRVNEPDPHAARSVAGITVADRRQFNRFDLQTSARAEYSTIGFQPDTIEVKDRLLAGGTFSGSYSLLDSLRLLGVASSSWRYPALDELAGYWSLRSPDRWMDVLPVPDFTTYYRGNPELDPVSTDYLAGGISMAWDDYRQARLLTGIRRWNNQIAAFPLESDTWSRENLTRYGSYETTLYAWSPLFGPASLAGAFSYAEPFTSSSPVPDRYGWLSARFLDDYYSGQLRIRATVTAYYWDEYQTVDDHQNSIWTWEALINAKIFNFEAYYGTRNITSAAYQFIPGYPNLHREEIWGVRWLLFK